MQPYKIEKKSKKRKVNKKIRDIGYCLNLKLKPRKNLVEVEKIYLYQPKLIKNYLKIQFYCVFKRLFRIVMACDEDSSDSDFGLALSEIERAKKIIHDKYRNQVSKEEYRSYYKKLIFLDNELRKKIVLRNQVQELMYEQQMTIKEKGGRGR